MLRKTRTAFIVFIILAVCACCCVWFMVYTIGKESNEYSRGASSASMQLSEPVPLAWEDAVLDTISFLEASSPTVVPKQSSLDLASMVHDMSGRYGIVVYNTRTGEKIAYNEQDTFVTASLYKLLELYPLIQKIHASQINWNTEAWGGWSVADCVDMMLRYSNNECGIAISNMVGLEYSDVLLSQMGLENTHLNNLDANGELAGDKTTTASDMFVYLQKLFYEDHLSQDEKDIILSILYEQEYREGIPKGVPDMMVADKVGFLDDYTHDAGIVVDDSHEYIVVILSQGSDWSAIAKLASGIRETWSK